MQLRINHHELSAIYYCISVLTVNLREEIRLTFNKLFINAEMPHKVYISVMILSNYFKGIFNLNYSVYNICLYKEITLTD